jgi:acyl carrier protein
MTGTLAGDIKKIVCDLLELDPTEVDESTPFDEFGMSSTMRVRLLATVETHFDVVVDTGELTRLVNLREVGVVVAEAIERRRSGIGGRREARENRRD